VFAFLLRVIVKNLKLLIAGALLAGIAGFVVASFATKYYRSSAYLSFNEDWARAANSIMSSPQTLDKVLAKVKVPGDTIEARRRYIDSNRSIVVAPKELPRTSKLFRLDFVASDPRVAQQVNSLFIESFIESTKPAPLKAGVIKADIERNETQAKSISDLLERLTKETPSLVVQNSLQGELATPISNLLAKRDQNLANVISLKQQLLGVSEDIVFWPPDLPEEPVWPQRSLIALLSAIGGGLLMLAFALLRDGWWRRAA
jgi:uncharacterized protein involved in exopolysaccharide biosynthesis